MSFGHGLSKNRIARLTPMYAMTRETMSAAKVQVSIRRRPSSRADGLLTTVGSS